MASTISIVALIAAAPACTLNTQGDNYNEDSSASTTPNPTGGGGAGGAGGAGGGAGAGPVCEECPDLVPEGWLRVGYAPDRSTPCPSGFVEADITTDAAPQADACVCGNCQMTTPPSCDAGAIQTYRTNASGPCKEAGTVLPNSPAGQCAMIQSNGAPVFIGASFAGTPPPPVGGACSRPASVDTSKIQWAEGRICLPTETTCDSDICAGMAPFSECILTNADTSCPAPFSKKYAPGTNDDVMCEACGCSLTVACEGTLTLYTDKACTAGDLDLPVTNACISVSSNDMYYAYQYTGKVKSTECADEPPVQASFVPAQTLCCK